ncbi:hypothetical protein BC834DRAFT_845277 [Gloeopeniophorella convolvens]|nr:hypothetical protein BC834DRAFT_845277 [Gloeopeniophorella convolvens]
MDLDELRELLLKPEHTDEEQEKILGLIDLTIPRGAVHGEPSLDALLYAAQGILYPTLSFDHIPELLDILTQIERTRGFYREHAKWTLIWQRFYEMRPDPKVRVLRKVDKEAIKKLLKPQRLDKTRALFTNILENAIRVHVLHLWTHAEHSYRLHHYLRIYFPWAHGRNDSQRLYHTFLSPEEEGRLADVAVSCFQFLRDAKLWEERRLRELDVPVYVFRCGDSFMG